MAAARMPMGPAPVTSTSSARRLKDRAVWVALPKGSKMEYSSSGILGEQEITLEAELPGTLRRRRSG